MTLSFAIGIMYCEDRVKHWSVKDADEKSNVPADRNVYTKLYCANCADIFTNGITLQNFSVILLSA